MTIDLFLIIFLVLLSIFLVISVLGAIIVRSADENDT